MNLEPKVESKALWWGGSYGGVTKDGNFLMLYRKPYLPGVAEFDDIVSKPLLGVGNGNFRVLKGVSYPLTAGEIDAMSAIIDAAFPTQGGGGGGGSADDAIVSLRPDGTNPNLVFTKGNGTTGTVPFKANIQNTPAHSMAIQLKSDGELWWYGDGGLPRGVPAVSESTIHFPPPELWDMPGQQRDARYNKEDGSIELLANNLEVSFMTTMAAGMDADDAIFGNGTPPGEYGFVAVIQRKNDAGNWETVNETKMLVMTMGTQYPNSQIPCISCKNKGFKLNIPKAGFYRVGFKVLMGSNASYHKKFKMFYSCWPEAEHQQDYYHIQMTGVIKDISTPEVIPPHTP